MYWSSPTLFQPAPYVPSANSPSAIRPHAPLTPWTLMAPTGSSIPIFSKNNTAQMTMTPATPPIRNAAHGATKAHGAVIATRPASMPLHIMLGSGFLPAWTHHMYRHEASAPDADASIVFTAV